MIIILDIDGVLADCNHRLHYLKEKNYKKFYSADEILNDKPIYDGFELLYSLMKDNKIIIITGRPYRTEEATRFWFKQKFSPDFEPEMYMRKDHDYRPSSVIKVGVMKKLGLQHLTGSIIFIDDAVENVKAVEENLQNVRGLLFGTSRLILK